MMMIMTMMSVVRLWKHSSLGTVMPSHVVCYNSGLFAQYLAEQWRNSYKAPVHLPSPVHTYTSMHIDRHGHCAAPDSSSLPISQGLIALLRLGSGERRESNEENNLFASCYSLLQLTPEELVDGKTLSAYWLPRQTY